MGIIEEAAEISLGKINLNKKPKQKKTKGKTFVKSAFEILWKKITLSFYYLLNHSMSFTEKMCW